MVSGPTTAAVAAAILNAAITAAAIKNSFEFMVVSTLNNIYKSFLSKIRFKKFSMFYFYQNGDALDYIYFPSYYRNLNSSFVVEDYHSHVPDVI
jgi:hypothetical protein